MGLLAGERRCEFSQELLEHLLLRAGRGFSHPGRHRRQRAGPLARLATRSHECCPLFFVLQVCGDGLDVGVGEGAAISTFLGSEGSGVRTAARIGDDVASPARARARDRSVA